MLRLLVEFTVYVDKESARKTHEALIMLGKTAIPYAVRSTLNDVAFQTRDSGMSNIQKNFINRNTYTKNRVYVNKATQRNITQMNSQTGHLLDYMETQENGDIVRPKTGRYKKIPTNAARISKDYKRVIRRVNRMSAIDVKSSNGKYFVGNLPSGKKGLFIKRRVGKKSKAYMIYDLSRRSVTLKKREWLEPAARSVATNTNMSNLYHKNGKRVIDNIEKKYGTSIRSVLAKQLL